MKKNCILIFTAIVFIILCGQLQAQDSFPIQILKLADLRSKFGAPVETYEDVDDITDIRPYFSGVGGIIDPGTLNSNYNSQIFSAQQGKNFLNHIAELGGLVYKEKSSFLNFLLAHLYLDAGSFDEEGNWHDQKVEAFPFTYKPGKKPHTKKYYLCLRDGWEYIPPSNDILPNAKSCAVAKHLCTPPHCQEEKKEDVNEDGDYDDSEDINEPEKHNQPDNNVYVKLGSALHARRTQAPLIDMNKSGVEFKMKFADRTPPRIEGCFGGKFPDLGTGKPATTGDWYKVEGLTITDNFSKHIGTCLVLGKIDKFPAKDWESEENWFPEPVRVIPSGGETDYIIMPNSCHGGMRYSVFAWDKDGNVNPGDPSIVENSPETCYGLAPYTDLGRDPGTAKDWPIKATLGDPNQLDSIDITTISPGDRRGEGIVHIRDNDFPNIVIRFESVKDNSRTYFPPVMTPGNLPVLNSTEFNKAAPDPEGNANIYRDFVGTTPDKKYDSEKLADTALGLPLYFKILDAKPHDKMSDADKLLLEDFKDANKTEFVRKHFRLEDYNQSDTKTDGTLEEDPDTFGARNSYGSEVTALLLPAGGGLQEDVEYLISVWADDNVKWATIDGLSAMVSGVMRLDVFAGHLFAFSNRRRSMIKILYWDKNGFCLWQKRLEKGRFRWPSSREEVLQVGQRELAWLLEGLEINQASAHKQLAISHAY